MAGAEERPGAQSSGGSIPRTFEPWYKDEFPRLVRALSLISGDRELAVDAASEACARALERWEQVSVMASPTGWTYTVGLNVVRRTLRRRNLERFLIRRHAVADPLLSPDIRTDLWDALSGLPHRERTAVVLYYFVDLPQHEVAHIMGVTPGTVAAMLHAARKKLRLGLEVDAGGSADA